MYIPKGALFEHTVNGVMRVIAPNGTVLFWANDDEAAQVTFPEGTTFPASAIHYLPKQSLILIPENYEATVYGTDTIISDFLRLAEQPPLMTTTAATWRDEQNASSQQLTPQGVCFADTGCSVGATSRGQLFLSKPQSSTNGPNIPVFSVQKFSDTMYVGKLSMLGSTDPANDRLIHIEKDRIDPDQPVKFNIMKSAAGTDSDAGVVLMAQANLTNQSSVLHYMITGTASISIPAMNITPKIWQKTEAGDVLVFTGEPVKCSGVNACQATGNFTPSDAASYFANATVRYTLPTNAAVPKFAVNVGSDVRVMTTTIDYYVFFDGVNKYHGYNNNTDLYGPVLSSQNFYKHMDGTVGSRCHEYNTNNYCWNDRKNPVDDDTGSKYWNKSESANSEGANSVQFAYHAGHGGPDGILFGTANKFHEMNRQDMEFSKAKWVVLSSCDVLNQTYKDNWKSVFKGVHIVMSFDTHGVVNASQGPMFAERMRGGTYDDISYPVTKISTAWQSTLEDTVMDDTLKGAYMYADPSQDDYLAGYGDFKEPTKTNGEYTITWKNFKCKKSVNGD